MSEFDIKEDESQMLEALVKSPVYKTLKDVLSRYRETCYQQLLTEESSNRMFEIRGRIIGVNVVTKLPELIVQRELTKKKIAQDKEDKEKELQMRAARIKDPTLPPLKKS